MAHSAPNTSVPSDARTIQWAPNAPAVTGGKPGQGSIGACDACRARKVRCLASENTMSNKCQRCARAGRECVYTVHSKTRRRKRTDTRVKELEEKVKNLSMLLEQGKQGQASVPSHKAKQMSIDIDDDIDEEDEEYSEDDEEEDYEDIDEDMPAIDSNNATRKAKVPLNRKSSAAYSTKSSNSTTRQDRPPMPNYHDGAGSESGISPDVVERGILTMKEATELFERYVNVLVPLYPAVIFKPGTTAAEVRESKPILFLACIAAAASIADPKLNLRLNQEILQVYATKVALQGLKNLDLVQSILLSSLWYYPPERFDQLKFHQYIHMAATMALDLGLGKRNRPRRPHQQPKRGLMPDYEPQKLVSGEHALSVPTEPAPNSSTIDSRRTILACYLQCASVSLSLRLPNALRFTSYMAECLDVLETSPEAAPTDKRFAAWIRIQRIIEDCVHAFALDDPESTVSLDDHRIQNLLQGYEKQMEEFRKNVAPGVMNPFLEVNYHVNNIFVHEICLHPDHEPEDFRPPFYVATQVVSKIPTAQHPAYVNAVMECISSAQTVINAFLSMRVETIRALPALIYVRTIYSCIVLIKIEISARAPDSDLGRVLDPRNLNVPFYLQKILAHMVNIVGTEGKNIIAAKFLMILKRLFEWYRTYQSHLSSHQSSAQHPAFQPSRPAEPNYKPRTPQPLPPQSTLQTSVPDFNTLPQATTHPAPSADPFAPFTAIPIPPHTQSPQAGPFTTSPPTSPPQPLPQYDYHANLLATNHSSPQSANDYNSPEYYPSFQQSSSHPNPTPSPDPNNDLGGRMEVDPNMFAQLQDMVRPFTFNPDPNDWMFDPEIMGLTSPGMGDMVNSGMGGLGGGMSGMGPIGSAMGGMQGFDEWHSGMTPGMAGAGGH